MENGKELPSSAACAMGTHSRCLRSELAVTAGLMG